MAFRNPKLFGLDINRSFLDIQDKTTALNSLNLPPNDLDVIRGSRNAGMQVGDWISLSNLSTPIYKTLDRFYYETSPYLSILSTKSGVDSNLFGNLTIRGKLSGSAIRYRYLDGSGPSAVIKIADISTSRVSAWSSNASPVLDNSPISYGARVGIITDGALKFGTSSSSEPRLNTTFVPLKKEFDSEIPTHKIKFKIGGKDVYLYAMKGIPVSFTGFFRNLDARIDLTSRISGIAPSWKIVDTNNLNSFVDFKNSGEFISYRSTSAKERYILFYYNPDNISSITLSSAGITNFPETKFLSLKTVNFSSNNFRNFPNFSVVSPNIENIYFSANPLYLSDNSSERKLNASIISKIPANTKALHLGQTFYGSISQNLIGNKFTQLQELNLYRYDGPYFHPDSDDSSSPIPNVSNTCIVYNIGNNDFRSISNSSGDSKNIKDLTNLSSLSLYGNYYLSDSNFSIATGNNSIQYIDISSTNLSCPSLQSKPNLQTFYGNYARNIGSLFDAQNNYKFDNCDSLITLSFYASPLTGWMPKFTNPKLSYLELRYTNLIGGESSDQSYVIPEKTFEKCPDLQYMLLQSGNLLTSSIHPKAFEYIPKVYYIWYISYGRTTGSVPNLSLCSNLTYLVLHYNNFNANVPTFTSNKNIYYVDMSYNSFSGQIPAYKNLSGLTYLFLYNNQFSSIQKFSNLPNLTYFYAHNNSITGEIPDFSECPALYYLILFNNKFTNYFSGSFSKIYNIKYIDLSVNSLSQQAVNSIINDLLENYNSVKRGGVTVNLRGNAQPSGAALENLLFLRSKGWNIAFE